MLVHPMGLSAVLYTLVGQALRWMLSPFTTRQPTQLQLGIAQAAILTIALTYIYSTVILSLRMGSKNVMTKLRSKNSRASAAITIISAAVPSVAREGTFSHFRRYFEGNIYTKQKFYPQFITDSIFCDCSHVCTSSIGTRS